MDSHQARAIAASPLAVIILAAGQGTRMRSDRPKVLHLLGDKPLLAHVVASAQSLNPRQICVVSGHAGAQVRAALAHLPITWVEQIPQLGTGHAVAQALPFLMPEINNVLILYGDVPLIPPATLERLLSAPSVNTLGLLTVELPDPTGYGRIIRTNSAKVQEIIEEKDATPEQRRIREINTGIMAVNYAHLVKWIAQLDNRNAQGEYYLTDIIRLAVSDGISINTFHPEKIIEVLGVNNRAQLAELERAYQMRRVQKLLESGVTLRDPARCDLRGELTFGRDVEFDIDVILEGKVQLGNRVKIGPYCYLKDAIIGDDVDIRAHSVLEGVTVGANCIIGPFARLRPGTELGAQVHIGNFVEIKQSIIAAETKINHLSYIGDAKVGSKVNIGAGTITCNYDGANKHQTIIGDQAFIGSNTALVAPVHIGKNATIGAGSVITRDAASGELTLARASQQTYFGWTRPVKK